MADNLEFLIRLLADVSGGKIAKQTLDELKQSGKLSAEELEQLNLMAKQGGESLAEAGKKTEEVTGHFGNLSKIANKLHHEVPLLGNLLHLAIHPIVATVTVATAVFEHFRRKIKEVEDALQPTSSLNFQKSMEDKRAAMESARLEAEAWQRAYVRLIGSEQDLQAQSDRVVKGIQAEAEAARKMLAALQALALARLPADDIEGRANVRKQFAAAGDAADLKTLRDTINAFNTEASTLTQRIPFLEAGLPAKQNNAVAAAGNLARDQSQREEINRGIKEEEERRRGIVGKLDDRGLTPGARAQFEDDLKLANERIDKMRDHLKTLDERIANEKRLADTTAELLRLAEDELTKAQQRKKDIQNNIIPGLRDQLGREEKNRPALRKIENETIDAENNQARNQQIINDVKSSSSQIGNSLGEVGNAFQGYHQVIMGQIDQLQRQINNLGSQFRTRHDN